MNRIFDEERFSPTELFRRKKDQDMREQVDEICREKSPSFMEARATGDFEGCFHAFCRDCDITLDDAGFVYFFDFDFQFVTGIKNMTPDYGMLLRQGLSGFLYAERECTNVFCRRYNSAVRDMMLLVDRIAGAYEKIGDEKADKKAKWFRRMTDSRADTFAEAMQRVLFVNQLLWQTGSTLVGLGRLDVLLIDFYHRNVAQGILTEGEAKEMLAEAFRLLHRHTWYKSGVMLGDIGQVILLGGTNRVDGAYQANELTRLILQVVKESHLTDPKIVLRVNRHIPADFMEEAVQCMMTGIGSPLLSNDDVIIPKLLAFGIETEDAYDYMTSACWETLIGGKSSAMNNQVRLSFVAALHQMLEEEAIGCIRDFEDLKTSYLHALRREVKRCRINLAGQKYPRNTVYSVFMDGCRQARKDIVDGGATYHNIGMTTIGLGNVVNALLNMDELVFRQGRYSLADVKWMTLYDFQHHEDVVSELKGAPKRFGVDDEQVIALTNEILREVTRLTEDFRTSIGGRIKFGVSSPDYIIQGIKEKASFDGRREHEPLMVHISDEYADNFTQILNFAAALDYGDNRINGNVADLMVHPAFLKRHFHKFTQMLMKAIEVGFFQLHVNVVGSDTLMDAKVHPERHQNLIVRVWGFSAHFVELPEEYQDVLIERALQNEKRRAA